jgi:hypothetical protein
MRARILRCCADSRPVHDPRLDLPGGLQVVLAAGLQPKPSRNPPEKNRRTESAPLNFSARTGGGRGPLVNREQR